MVIFHCYVSSPEGRKYHSLVVIFVEGSGDPKPAEPATFWGSGHGRYPQLQRHAGDGVDWTGDDQGWLNCSSDQKCGQDQQPEVYEVDMLRQEPYFG